MADVNQPVADAAAKMPEIPKTDVSEYPERILMDFRTECNLKCPMCLLHGNDDDPEKKAAAIGEMGVENARQILDEVMHARPLIQPSLWGEPLLAHDLREHFRNIKERGITIALNTNGLTLREDLARFFVEIKLDSIFFSIDSTTPETLRKVRGVDKLDKIKRNVEMMLRVRDEMGADLPRIGATFTAQPENEHELDAFVEHWTKIVDVVRVGAVFAAGKLTGIEPPKERTPCQALYNTMPIHYNGDVSICCFDSHGVEVMGNVFQDGGVKAVWHGDTFNEVRRHHETGNWDAVPFCKGCNAWTGYLYDEKREGDLLVRRSAQFIYYNRIDRLKSWTEKLRGHAAPGEFSQEKAKGLAAE
jgi:MoaA/NifB/PqqE/SkfB family radical SAM enzyme